jgi:polyamine oxidase
MDVLHTMYPDMDHIPQPTSILFYKWYNDPLTRGSYSNWPASFFQEHHVNLRATVSDRLWFTGEHCSQKYFVWVSFDYAAPANHIGFLTQGFLHGAWFEGQDAGQELARCIKGDNCTSIREHFEEVKNAQPYKIDGCKPTQTNKFTLLPAYKPN